MERRLVLLQVCVRADGLGQRTSDDEARARRRWSAREHDDAAALPAQRLGQKRHGNRHRHACAARRALVDCLRPLMHDATQTRNQTTRSAPPAAQATQISDDDTSDQRERQSSMTSRMQRARNAPGLAAGPRGCCPAPSCTPTPAAGSGWSPQLPRLQAPCQAPARQQEQPRG